MNSAQLDNMKSRSAEILVQFTNGYIDSRLRGTKDIGKNFKDCMRLHYLYGAMDNAILVGSDIYVGSQLIAPADVAETYHKIYHYNGVYQSVDLSDYSDIVADSGDGDSGSGTTPTPSEDFYRAGSVYVGAGSATVTFSSPLPSTDYQVDAYVRTASGYEQDNLGTITKSLNGFSVSEVLEAGTLIYFVVISL